MQLKAFIKKSAEEKKISAQLIMQNYMMERLLERISLSPYKRNFILKGGFLIASIIGLDTRATMDLDTTVKGFPLTHNSIHKIFEEICVINVEDDFNFTFNHTADIREGDDYPGLRVNLTANYSPLAVPVIVDVTTGDKITPQEVEYSYKLMFDDRSISILAYNLETILAEKLETILSRNIANTRPRDFYDVHILYTLHSADYDMILLQQALNATMNKRGSISMSAMKKYSNIIENIRKSPQMRGFWERYQKDYRYAKNISFDDTCNTVLKIMNMIST